MRYLEIPIRDEVEDSLWLENSFHNHPFPDTMALACLYLYKVRILVYTSYYVVGSQFQGYLFDLSSAIYNRYLPRLRLDSQVGHGMVQVGCLA